MKGAVSVLGAGKKKRVFSETAAALSSAIVVLFRLTVPTRQAMHTAVLAILF